MTPSTEPFCGMSILVSAFHRESRQYPLIPRRHASMCGCMMERARISSTWGKVSGKDACPRNICTTCFSRRFRVWPINAFSLLHSHHGQHGAIPTKGENREKGHLAHRPSRRSEGEGGRGGAEIVGYAVRDDAGIVSRSSEGLERMVTVIVTAFSALGTYRLQGDSRDDVRAK